MYSASLHDVEIQLEHLGVRIQKDLQYTNGKWDTRLYNADPYTPYPNGSSGFSHPLYVITQEGFVIERSQPIKGFLDTSDFNRLLRFENPTTIDTITNEKWRIVSKPIQYKGITQGVIVVSYYNPHENEKATIDQDLAENISLIASHVKTSAQGISVEQVDIRHIHYEFSFEVVDKFNHVLINNGRVPTFIDASYFAKEVNASHKRIVFNDSTKEEYLVVEKLITDKEGQPVGIIVMGESVRSMFIILKKYLMLSLFVGLFLSIPLLTYTVIVMQKELFPLFIAHPSQPTQVSTIWFDKETSTIHLDKKTCTIPSNSNQYYVCESIFSAPSKKWEYDQLLDKLGDTSDELNTRKIYDAVLAINKKCAIKLIEYKGKVFFMNPLYASRLSSSK